MMGLSFQHILLFGAVALLLFGGRGRISDIMGDFAKGIRSFKKGLNDPEDEPVAPTTAPRTLETRAPAPAAEAEKQKVG